MKKENPELLVSADGDMIYVICNTDYQQDMVVRRMTTDNCMLEDYEIWDDGEDRKWILKFRVLDFYELKPELN